MRISIFCLIVLLMPLPSSGVDNGSLLNLRAKTALIQTYEKGDIETIKKLRKTYGDSLIKAPIELDISPGITPVLVTRRPLELAATHRQWNANQFCACCGYYFRAL